MLTQISTSLSNTVNTSRPFGYVLTFGYQLGEGHAHFCSNYNAAKEYGQAAHISPFS